MIEGDMDDVMDVEERRNLPKELTPINIKAWLSNVGFTCGCSEEELVIGTLKRLLEWHEAKDVDYEHLFPGQPGVFYILASVIDSLGLAEHGSAIRYPWLTDDGKRLLEALRKHPPEEIESCSGEAYDGLSYGIM